MCGEQVIANNVIILVVMTVGYILKQCLDRSLTKGKPCSPAHQDGGSAGPEKEREHKHLLQTRSRWKGGP